MSSARVMFYDAAPHTADMQAQNLEGKTYLFDQKEIGFFIQILVLCHASRWKEW